MIDSNFLSTCQDNQNFSTFVGRSLWMVGTIIYYPTQYTVSNLRMIQLRFARACPLRNKMP